MLLSKVKSGSRSGLARIISPWITTRGEILFLGKECGRSWLTKETWFVVVGIYYSWEKLTDDDSISAGAVCSTDESQMK